MNWNLRIGLILCAFFIIIAVFGPLFATHDPKIPLEITYIQTPEGGKLLAPPVMPGRDYYFGSDKWGYDVFSMMLYGAKYTIFFSLLVSLFRVIVGSGAGILLGFSVQRRIGKLNMSALNAIPGFLIIFFVLFGISINSKLSNMELTVVTGTILVLLGLPGVIATVQGKTNELRNKEFILATHALGASKWRLIAKHIFPHLRESLLIMFVSEVILVLSVIGQLSLFHIFLGGTLFQSDPPSPPIYRSLTYEWAGMIGQSRMNYLYNQYLLLIPLGFYVLLLISLFLVSKGLEKRYRQQYSKPPYL